jgi:SH3-like domain-containing protein
MMMRLNHTPRRTWTQRLAVSSAALTVLLAVSAGSWPMPAAAQADEDGPASRSGLPVPRFVVLRADEVNARTGPGTRHPVRWVYKRRDMPVEIRAEHDTWRLIRDVDGDESWVHQSMLTGGRKRTVIVSGETRALRSSPDPQARIVAHAEKGAILRIVRCRDAWCELEGGTVTGWLRKTEVWGVYPDEKVN